MDSVRAWAENAGTMEWGIAVVAAVVFFYGLGWAFQKLFGSKRPDKPRP